MMHMDYVSTKYLSYNFDNDDYHNAKRLETENLVGVLWEYFFLFNSAMLRTMTGFLLILLVPLFSHGKNE